MGTHIGDVRVNMWQKRLTEILPLYEHGFRSWSGYGTLLNNWLRFRIASRLAEVGGSTKLELQVDFRFPALDPTRGNL